MVGNMGISPAYFWNEMSLKEVIQLLEVHNNQLKENWEQVRQICYFSSISVLNEGTKATEIMPFSWDLNDSNESTKPKITDTDRERIKQLSEIVTNNITNGRE